MQHYLQARPRDWHKGLSGHVLIIGGDEGFSGAPRMAAEAALRVGAGLVSVATRKAHAALINASRPEIMSHGVEEVDELIPLIQKADVIVIGTGLGQLEWGIKMWDVVKHETKPMVVDADALNLLAKNNLSNLHWVLTPHPGEAARLLNTTTEDIQKNRLVAAKEIYQKFGGVCVLKGAGSIVVAQGEPDFICDKGNPGMATAGMGDVLSGVIAGLLAQKIPLFEAAKIGVDMHAAAGDLAAKSGERGMIATDLMFYLHFLANSDSEE